MRRWVAEGPCPCRWRLPKCSEVDDAIGRSELNHGLRIAGSGGMSRVPFLRLCD